MLNFKSFQAARSVLAGIELMHMIRKGQFAIDGLADMSFAAKFYALAGQVRPAAKQQRDRTGHCAIAGKFCLLINNATEPLTFL